MAFEQQIVPVDGRNKSMLEKKFIKCATARSTLGSSGIWKEKEKEKRISELPCQLHTFCL